ncbi:MAG TPA: N-acetylglucosamine-6-phosphate deacetylase [Solirubrobacteraceae bacterium]|nr:N-acetylglucosamine-6-phosphate deacetylase [Solirubrobacteraceae bacterium]
MSWLVAGYLARNGRAAPGWIEIEEETIVAAQVGSPPRPPDERFDGLIAPGLVDLQVNGAAGHEVTGGHSALDAIDAVQLAHGVTGYLAAVVSAGEASADAAVAAIAERAADPASPVAGIHLEGPFLSPEHAGMHPLASLRRPSDGVPNCYDSPAVRLATLAPELPGALELIARLRRRGIAVALGHSGATADQARAAIRAGATMITHVFNAMGPLRHREPGLAGVALVDERVSVGVIADGHHVDPVVLEIVRRAAGRRTVLVSDASPAADAAPGRYQFGGVAIVRDPDGVVHTTSGRLAGSSLTLDAAVRGWATLTRATLPQAIRAASEAPARVLGLQSGLRSGRRADLVLVDRDGFVQRVMRRGRWLTSG